MKFYLNNIINRKTSSKYSARAQSGKKGLNESANADNQSSDNTSAMHQAPDVRGYIVCCRDKHKYLILTTKLTRTTHHTLDERSGAGISRISHVLHDAHRRVNLNVVAGAALCSPPDRQSVLHLSAWHQTTRTCLAIVDDDCACPMHRRLTTLPIFVVANLKSQIKI